MNMSIEVLNDKFDPKKRLVRFLGLTLLVSIPLWIFATLSTQFIPKGMPVNNIGFVMVFIPSSVALILTYKERGPKAAKNLLGRAFDYKKIKRKVRYLPILSLIPLISFLSFGLMAFLGMDLSIVPINLEALPILLILFFIFAISEEIGWQGYVFDIMKAQWNNLFSAITLGGIWALWHLPLYLLQESVSLVSIVGQCLFTAVLRILIVWIYNNNDKSVSPGVVVHTISNICTMLLPIYSVPLGPLIVSAMLIITMMICLHIKPL